MCSSIRRLVFSLEVSATHIEEHRLYLQEVCWYVPHQKKPQWNSNTYDITPLTETVNVSALRTYNSDIFSGERET